MRRLITAGCSFTGYTPCLTWPVFLSELFDETYNYGQSGAGNKFIFSAVIDADTRLKLTPDDLVVVAWSGFFRHDMIKRDIVGENIISYWETLGDWNHWPVNNLRPAVYKCLTEEFTEAEYIYTSQMYMLALARYLKAKNIPYIFTSLEDVRDIGCLVDNKYGEVEELYNDRWIIPEGLTKFIEKDKQQLTKKLGYYWGHHPSNSLHYKIAEKIAKTLGFSLSLHDNLFELDRLTINEEEVCNRNIGFTAHRLYLKCMEDISPNRLSDTFRTIHKYHQKTLPIHKQILKDICS